MVNAKHLRAAAGEFKTVKSSVAPDIQYSPTLKLLRQEGRDRIPFKRGKIPERMMGRCLYIIGQMKVLEPWSQSLDRLFDTVQRFGAVRGNVEFGKWLFHKKPVQEFRL